ncbi:hypothetical protein MKW92_039748, partial [Papaver armeniacum]
MDEGVTSLIQPSPFNNQLDFSSHPVSDAEFVVGLKEFPLLNSSPPSDGSISG